MPSRRPDRPNGRKGAEVEIYANRDQQRRAVYASDPETANRERKRARENYTPTTHTPKLTNGLLSSGTRREVIVGDMDHPIEVETFSVVQAAAALGRSEATLRRWIADDRIPAPYLRDTRKGNLVYSVGELQVIAGVIRQHEREFVYLATQNTFVVETLQQAVHAYRAQFI